MMNSFSQLITNRRSIRKFTSKPIEPEYAELILKAGLKSPSSKNSKPWHFIAIEDKDTLNKLSNCKKTSAKFISECSLAIVITVDPLLSSVWIEDASIAAIMIQLQAEDLGIGSCWVQIRERYTEYGSSSEDYIKELLNIPMQLQVITVVALGYKYQDKTPVDDDNPDWEKVHIGRY